MSPWCGWSCLWFNWEAGIIKKIHIMYCGRLIIFKNKFLYSYIAEQCGLKAKVNIFITLFRRCYATHECKLQLGLCKRPSAFINIYHFHFRKKNTFQLCWLWTTASTILMRKVNYLSILHSMQITIAVSFLNTSSLI